MRIFNQLVVKSGVLAALLISTLSPVALAQQAKAFVYTELQISVPFSQVPWQNINKTIKQQPGFINKTWLSGAGNQSAGGLIACTRQPCFVDEAGCRQSIRRWILRLYQH